VSTTVQVIIVILAVIGYLASPVALVWGWIRWINLPKLRTVSSILSFAGFILATASALLGIFIIVHAQTTGGYPFYDPRAMRIYALGTLLALGGIILGIGGIWRPSSLRWHAPVSGLGMLAFWILAAEGE